MYLIFIIEGSYLCPVNVLPILESNSTLTDRNIIDFVWLTSNYFVLVYKNSSSSECHLYLIETSRTNKIVFVQAFPVGLTLVKESEKNRIPNKKIFSNQPSHIVKLHVGKQKNDNFKVIFLFAMKSNGDIFLMEFDQNQLINR